MSRPISSSPAFRGHYCSWNSPARPGMAAALDPPGFWFWSPDRRARVVTAFERFIHSEGLDNFEREITIYNPSLARITQSLRGSIRHGTATVYKVLTESTSRARHRAEQNRGQHYRATLVMSASPAVGTTDPHTSSPGGRLPGQN
jgi:hypothetical protein